jgi:NTE family protein
VIFPPVLVEGVHYVDGGVSTNLPVEPFEAVKDQVVAVHVNPLPPFVPGRRGILRTMDRVWHLNIREMVMRSAQGCHLFIEPPELARFNMFELSRLEAIEEIGYAWTRNLLTEGH